MVTQWQQLFYEDRFVSQYLNFFLLSSALSYFRIAVKESNADSRFNIGPYPSEGRYSASFIAFQALCVLKHSLAKTSQMSDVVKDHWSYRVT